MSAVRRTVRIGMLGAGAISQIVHLPIITERTDVQVVAVSDRDAPKARAIVGEREAPLPEEQRALMVVIEDAYRSAAKGREITL